MEDTLFEWLTQIPQTIANFSGWLTSPIKSGLIDSSPLELLGIAGVTVVIGIIVVHVVRLFV